MRTVLTVFLAICLSAWVYASEQGIQHTREAIDILKSHLAAAEQSGAVSQQELQERKLELIEGRILLAELENQPDAVTSLLQEIVEHWAAAESRRMELVKAGVGSAEGLLSARRESLAARTRLAQHTSDRAALQQLSKQCVELETQRLEEMKEFAKAGLVPQSELARQRIRIVRASRISKE